MNMAFPAGISQILGLDAPSILRESGKTTQTRSGLHCMTAWIISWMLICTYA